MANSNTGNTFYVDATGELTTRKNVLIGSVVFSPNAGGDAIILKETSSSGTKLKVVAASATTIVIDLSSAPIVFANGIYVDTITSGAVATLIETAGRGE